MGVLPGLSPRLSIQLCTSARWASSCSTHACMSASWLSSCSIFSVYGRTAWLKAAASRSGIGSALSGALFIAWGTGAPMGMPPLLMPRTGMLCSCGCCWRGYMSAASSESGPPWIGWLLRLLSGRFSLKSSKLWRLPSCST
jgi:hypothetical protein